MCGFLAFSLTSCWNPVSIVSWNSFETGVLQLEGWVSQYLSYAARCGCSLLTWSLRASGSLSEGAPEGAWPQECGCYSEISAKIPFRCVWMFDLEWWREKICISYLFSDCDTLLIFKTPWNCIQELCKVDHVYVYLCVCVCLHVASLQLSIEDFRHLRWQVVGVAETLHSWRQEV